VTATTKKQVEDAALWQWTLDALLRQGCVANDAIEGANLVLEAYQSQRAVKEAQQPCSEVFKKSGIRRRPRE
jgi:hypothetical protein